MKTQHGPPRRRNLAGRTYCPSSAVTATAALDAAGAGELPRAGNAREPAAQNGLASPHEPGTAVSGAASDSPLTPKALNAAPLPLLPRLLRL